MRLCEDWPSTYSKGGESRPIISDLAAHPGVRSREELMGWIETGGLGGLEKVDNPARHPRSMDRSDLFFDARSQEVVAFRKVGVKA